MLFWNKLWRSFVGKFFVLKVSFFNIILAKDERKQLTFSLLNLVNRFIYMIVKHALSLFRHVYKCLLMKCSMSQHITWLKFYIILFIFCDKNCWLDLCFPSSSSLNGDLWLSVNIEEKNIPFSSWCQGHVTFPVWLAKEPIVRFISSWGSTFDLLQFNS